MIVNDVVLVLGAGASCDYGFPLGVKLKRDIIDYFSSGSNRQALASMHSIPVDFQLKFCDELKNSSLASIDSWLEGRPEYTELGKTAICFQIGKQEYRGRLEDRYDGHGSQSGWYHVLWQKMKAGAKTLKDLSENRISIVTYNYDRSLEEFLMKSAKATFGRSQEQCAEYLNKIPIIHVHGQTGYLDWQANPRSLPVKHYAGDSMDWEIAQECAKGIYIVHDSDEGPNYKSARDLISKASAIYFLGFGYAYENLQRLSDGNENACKEILGTIKIISEYPVHIREGSHNGFGKIIFLKNVSIPTLLNECAVVLNSKTKY